MLSCEYPTFLSYESIHPFEDGNGRIGRALAEECLSQELGHSLAVSISNAISKNKSAYYDALKVAQRSLEITDWILFSNKLNERQTKALNKMWEAGPGGFGGGMTAKKYISITKTSKATATRD